MKKILFVLTLICFTSQIFSNEGDNDNTKEAKEISVIGKAKNALKAYKKEATKGDLSASVKNISPCFDSNYVTEVTFYRTTPCPSKQNCVQLVEIVGKVKVDCNNEIIEIICGESSAQ
jgi:hypothetical protein